MKKITALLLCFLLLCTSAVTAFASEIESKESSAVISASVPYSHKITVVAEGAKVFFGKKSANEFTVERLSTPKLLIRPENGKTILSVTLNGVDVTSDLSGGYLTLAPVYEDKVLSVTTEDEPPVASKDTYTVKGTVTLNGQPLAGVKVELRSTVKTDKTDRNGRFSFRNVEPGKHSLTVLSDGDIIGYLSFALQKDSKTDVGLLDDGTYFVSVDKNGAGVELHLMLNEEDGTLVPTAAATIQKSLSPQTGDNFHLNLWRILMIASAVCIVVLETYLRKTQQNNQ